MSLLATLLAALLGAGCRSTGGPGSASFASVEIPGKSHDEIRAATIAVFRADGYSAEVSRYGEMVFHKEGSLANQLAYGGLIATQQGNVVLIRVKANIVPLASSHRLQCQAFMVRHAGDSFFEEENRLTNIRSRPYQKLLNKVSKQLKESGPT